MMMDRFGFVSKKKTRKYILRILDESSSPTIREFIKKEDAVKAYLGIISSSLTLTPTLHKVWLIEEYGNEFKYLATFTKGESDASNNNN